MQRKRGRTAWIVLAPTGRPQPVAVSIVGRLARKPRSRQFVTVCRTCQQVMTDRCHVFLTFDEAQRVAALVALGGD